MSTATVINLSEQAAAAAGLQEQLLFSPRGERLDTQYGNITYGQYLALEGRRIGAHKGRTTAIVERPNGHVALFVNPVAKTPTLN